MIMEHLDILSLLCCRLVSKPWNATASGILKKRPVWIKREWDSETFDCLYKCVERSRNFPFSRLDLSVLSSKQSADINLKKAVKLFKRFGIIFTYLRVHDQAKENVETVEKMLQSLLEVTSELQYLELGNLPASTGNDTSEFCLSSLRTLNLCRLNEEGDSCVLEKIICAAPKLKEIQHVLCSSATQMAAITRTQKLSLVSSMVINDSTGMQICTKLALRPPQLTALTVQIQKPGSRRCFVALRAILAESQNSLKKLKLCEFPRQLVGLPVLHKLEELDLVVRDPTSAVLHRLSNLCFPKLKKIKLESVDSNVITPESICENFWKVCDGPLNTVDTLELESYCDQSTMIYLVHIFPRVTYVRLNYHKFRYGSLPYYRHTNEIWFLKVFPSLSKLNIINFPFEFGIMDTFLTGIPCNIVERLETAPKQILSPCISRILRVQGNILQLKSTRQKWFMFLKSFPAFISCLSVVDI